MNKNTDNFYSHSRKWDMYRLPLVEPFELVSADRGYTWTLKFPDKDFQISNVQAANVNDSIFVIYTDALYFSGEMTEVWAVINAASKQEKMFTSKGEFEQYVQGKNYKIISLYPIDSLFAEFEKTKRLPPGWPKN